MTVHLGLDDLADGIRIGLVEGVHVVDHGRGGHDGAGHGEVGHGAVLVHGGVGVHADGRLSGDGGFAGVAIQIGHAAQAHVLVLGAGGGVGDNIVALNVLGGDVGVVEHVEQHHRQNDHGDDDDQRDDFLLRQEGLLLDGLAIAFGRSAGFLCHRDFIPFETNDLFLL